MFWLKHGKPAIFLALPGAAFEHHYLQRILQNAIRRSDGIKPMPPSIFRQ